MKRYYKKRRVGKKKHTTILNEEINKVEQARPPRVKRNGRELKTDVQESYKQEKDELSIRTGNREKVFNRNGRLSSDYFNKPCIYLLYKESKCVYIGQTIKLAKRISEHLSSSKDFDQFIIHSFQEDEHTRLSVERILIRKYKPLYNVVHK